MGYDLEARHKDVGWFEIGAFSFPLALEICNYLWPCIQGRAKWFCVFGVDERMPKGHKYPAIISNDGFRVTAEEARIVARMLRNYVAIQRELPDENGEDHFDKPDWMRPWPCKIRTDFVDKFEALANWAEQSGGFRIW